MISMLTKSGMHYVTVHGRHFAFDNLATALTFVEIVKRLQNKGQLRVGTVSQK